VEIEDFGFKDMTATAAVATRLNESKEEGLLIGPEKLSGLISNWRARIIAASCASAECVRLGS